MIRFDALLRAAAVAACLSVAVAALCIGWAATTRTTPAGEGVIYRQNLVTGRATFCSPVGCMDAPRTTRPAVDAPPLDFSDRAKGS